MMLHRLLNPEVEEERKDASLNARQPSVSGKSAVASTSTNGHISAFPSGPSSLSTPSLVPLFKNHPTPTIISLTPVQKGKARAQSSSPLSSAADDNEDENFVCSKRTSSAIASKSKPVGRAKGASTSTTKSVKISMNGSRQTTPAPRQVPARAKRSSVSASATGLGGLSFMERKEIEEIVEECRERMVQDAVPALEDSFPPIKFLLNPPSQLGYVRVDRPKASTSTSVSFPNMAVDRSGFSSVSEAEPSSSRDSRSSKPAAPTPIKKLPTQSWKILDEETEAIVGGGRLRRRKENTTIGQQDTSDEYYTKLHRKYETFEKKQKRLEKEKWAHERYNLKKRIELIKSMEAKSFSALVNAIAEKTPVVERPGREVDPEELREKLLEEAEVVLKRYDLLLPTRDHSKPKRADHAEDPPSDSLALPVTNSTALLPSRVSSLRHSDGSSSSIPIKHRPTITSSTASTPSTGQPTSSTSPLPFKSSTSRKRRYSSVSVDSDEHTLIIAPHNATSSTLTNIRSSNLKDPDLDYNNELGIGHKPVITPKPRPRRNLSSSHDSVDETNEFSSSMDIDSRVGRMQSAEGEDLPGRDESGRFLPGFGGVQPARGEGGKFLPRDPTGPVRKRSSTSLKRSSLEQTGRTDMADALNHEMNGDVEMVNVGLVSADLDSTDEASVHKPTTAPSRVTTTARSKSPCLLVRAALKHLPSIQSKPPISTFLPSPSASISPPVPLPSTFTPPEPILPTHAAANTLSTPTPISVNTVIAIEGASPASNPPPVPLPIPSNHLVPTPTKYVSPKHSTRGVNPRESIAALRGSRSNKPWGMVLPAAVTFKSDFDLDGDIWIPFLDERLSSRQQQHT